VKEPKENHKPEFRVNPETIEVKEDEEHILYIAKRGGYVVFEEGVYDIRDEMEIDEVNFKETGSIDAGAETEVKLHIQEQDVMKDAVGTGVEVDAQEVKVAGNVGSAAVIRAEQVEVGGQTHQNSKIFAEDYAEVNVLRGYLKAGKLAKINRIEGGKVEANTVEVAQMVGGEVRAMEISVQVVGANTRLYAAKGIIIQKMVGENNRFMIDPGSIDAYHDEFIALDKAAEELKKRIEKEREKLNEKLEVEEKSKMAVAVLKQKIMADQKRGMKPKPAFVMKIKQHQQLKEQIAEEKKKLQALESKLEQVHTRLTTYQDMVLHATVTNYGAWTEYTTIEFHLLYPKMKLEYVPKPGESGQTVYLKSLGDEGYVLAVREADAS
jgi:hypothetical protein